MFGGLKRITMSVDEEVDLVKFAVDADAGDVALEGVDVVAQGVVLSGWREVADRVVVDQGAEVAGEVPCEGSPILHWHLFGQSDVPKVCRACQMESCVPYVFIQ